jgi:uncharacterized membrane protein
MLGLYIILARKKIGLGITISVLSLGWFILSLKVLQPYFGISEPLGALYFFAGGETISSPVKIMQYCITHPFGVMQRVFSYAKLGYLIRLFAPLGFLSLLSLKELLIGLPIFLQNLILSEHLVKVEVPRYTMPLIPFIFISAIYSAAWLFKNKKLRWVYIEVLITISLLLSVSRFVLDARFLRVLSPISGETMIHRSALKEMVSLIPPEASVCADIKAFPFLSNRFRLYDIPFHIQDSEYVLIDVKEPIFSPKAAISAEECAMVINKALKPHAYEMIKEKDGVILLRRDPGLCEGKK